MQERGDAAADEAASGPAGDGAAGSTFQPEPPIQVAIEGQIAVVTLNRPARRNALTLDMWREMPRICDRLDRDPEVRCIIVTGAGGHFTGGADILEFDKVRRSVADAAAYEHAVDACCDALAGVSKPTIAAITGVCMGGGCHVAISCDFRYVHADAVFAIPAARLSIVYGIRGTQKLVSLVGVANAKRLLYAADRIDAAEAHRIGLADCVAPDALAAARDFALRLAGSAPLSISGAKTLVNGLALGLGALDPLEAQRVIDLAAASEDYAEGRQAFAEKRQPRFKGR